MKRALPVWLAAVLPATLAGHGLAYAITGRSAAGAEHAWMAPAMEISLALLFAICTALIGGTLCRAGILKRTRAERSLIVLWPRLAVAQLLLFTLIERTEGARAGFTGSLVQILVAFLAAWLLCLFARVLARCRARSREAGAYLERMLCASTSFVSRRPAPMAYALAVRAGRARFQRPPPFV